MLPGLARGMDIILLQGFTLRARLTAHPSYVLTGEPWLDPRVLPHVAALADPRTGLAVEEAVPQGIPWQEPDPDWGSAGRLDLHTAIDTQGRLTDTRSDFDAAYGDWDVLREQVRERPSRTLPVTVDAEVKSALRAAERNPAGLSDAQALALIRCPVPP